MIRNRIRHYFAFSIKRKPAPTRHGLLVASLYMKLTNCWEGVLTGNSSSFGGSGGRVEAVGYGVDDEAHTSWDRNRRNVNIPFSISPLMRVFRTLVLCLLFTGCQAPPLNLGRANVRFCLQANIRILCLAEQLKSVGPMLKGCGVTPKLLKILHRKIGTTMKNNSRNTIGLFTLFAALVLTGCSTVYYNTMEKLGFEKRDILVDRVENARDAQTDAQETFRSSLERFQSVVAIPDTELKAKYEEIRDASQDSEDAAEKVRDRIDSVEDVAGALFAEWEDELDLYESASLRRSSEQQLQETRNQYGQLINRMHQAESRMEPVLQAFEDQVLYLKHNLNAQAIGALETELGKIRSDVDTLIRNMEASIAESEAFIRRFRDQ